MWVIFVEIYGLCSLIFFVVPIPRHTSVRQHGLNNVIFIKFHIKMH